MVEDIKLNQLKINEQEEDKAQSPEDNIQSKPLNEEEEIIVKSNEEIKKDYDQWQKGLGENDTRKNEQLKIKQVIDKSEFFGNKTWTDPAFKLPKNLIKAIEDLGYDRPSKIQQFTIPLIASTNKINVIAQSKNGSGKTLAFSLGSLTLLNPEDTNIQIVVLAPTRELAIQIHAYYQKLCKYLNAKITLVGKDTKKEDIGQVMIGSPGYLERFIQKNKNSFQNVKAFVIDEADQLFSDQTQTKTVQMMKSMNQNKQCILFSATFPVDILNFIQKVVTNAAIITTQNLTLKGVKQYCIQCKQQEKPMILKSIIQKCNMNQMIIFINTKKYAKKINELMVKEGFKVSLLHGEMTNEERDAAIQNFKDQKSMVLITTNLLSRGFDNRMVKLVINFDVPIKRIRIENFDKELPDSETYLHRIGRTGRFGDEGIALNLLERDRDYENLQEIKKHFGCDITEAPTLDQIKEDLDKLSGDFYNLQGLNKEDV